MYDYFAQMFAQVTNPPLDAIREELDHLAGGHGRVPSSNLLDPQPGELQSDRDAVQPIITKRGAGQAPATSTRTAPCPGWQHLPAIDGLLPGDRRASRPAIGLTAALLAHDLRPR